MKIHGHTILTKLKIPSKLWDEQAAFVRGYILALEDTLGDLEKPGQDADPMWLVLERIQATLTQARATLATLEEMENEAANRRPGASDTPGAPDPEDQGRVPD